MKVTTIQIKVMLIAALVIIITVFHYSALHGNLRLHIIHRELYFLPILMAAFWFGLKIGLMTSLGISFAYAPYVFLFKVPHSEWLTIVSQIFIFNLVGVILGWMVDREREQQKERNYINDTFGKYVDRKVRDEILSRQIPLDGEVKDVTILFADLRDFTKLVESTRPKKVVMILNEYFKEMSEAIKAHQGLVLQFIGDEIESVFGAPISLKDHQKLAVEAALDMRRRLSLVNLKLINQGYKPIQHGIGIHTGQVLAASIGSPDRLSYAMVGDSVNIASRIQELNKHFGTDILISATTKAGLDNTVITEKLPPTSAKGLSEPLQLYKIKRREDIYLENS